MLAAFRLVLHRIAAIEPVGRKIAAAMSTHFAAWLHETENSAVRLHAKDLGSFAA